MRILIRADASHAVGTGHVMRMLALAQAAVARGAQLTLASTGLVPGVAARAEAMGVEVVGGALEAGSPADAAWVEALALERGARWVVADGYPFGDAFQKAVRGADLRLMLVDDYGHCTHYAADIVLNQNLSADASLYAARAPYTRLLLGPEYVLMREEFRGPLEVPGSAPARAERILVTFGGSDPADGTRLAIDALRRLDWPGLEARVLVGPSNPRMDAYRAQAGDDPRITLLSGSDDVASLMAWSDLAVAAAGTTTYELCRMGVPSLLVVVADNQRALARAAADRGVAIDLGRHEGLDAPALARAITELAEDVSRRVALAEAGRRTVDGMGCQRVLEALYCSE